MDKDFKRNLTNFGLAGLHVQRLWVGMDDSQRKAIAAACETKPITIGRGDATKMVDVVTIDRAAIVAVLDGFADEQIANVTPETPEPDVDESDE